MVAAASPASPAAAANQVEAAPPEVQPPPHSQRDLYGQYKHLVDIFIGTVTDTTLDSGQLMSRLREQQLQAESAGLLDLVNQLCYWHVLEGRTPLAYATVLNLTPTVRVLIDLKADVNAEVCPPVASECAAPLASIRSTSQMGASKTALTLAVDNKKFDGTEMVRLLLSKGANPEQLEAAGIDEGSSEYREQLNVSMRHWLSVARRVGVQDEKMKAHLAHLPSMDKMHELHYSIVGEEPAVALIKRSLSARFGNPAGQSKPLVILLLGPPGHGDLPTRPRCTSS